MENQRVKARQLRKINKNEDAIIIYNELWANKEPNWDLWLGWEYADSLKKVGKVDEAILICKTTYFKDKTFKYNKDLLCWCLFEKYIKPYNSNILSEFHNFIKIANFIIQNTVQDGKKTANEATIFKVLKILQEQNNVRQVNLLKWANKLDHTKLSQDVIEFTFSDGLSKEGASRKEQYFKIKSKALQKTNQYEECIKCCNIAFQEIDKFHYDNQIWLEVRKQYCICMSNNNDSSVAAAAKRINELALLKKHWSIYATAFECFCHIKNYEQAIISASKAMLSNDPIDKKVGLLFQMGILFELLNEIKKAKEYYYFVYIIRKDKEWQIPQELQQKINYHNLQDTNYSINKLKQDLRTQWISNVKADGDMFEGIVSNIVMPRRKSGFIKTGEQSYFFNTSSIVNGYPKLKIGAKVTYNLIDAIHPVTKLNTRNAVNIEIL